MLEMCPECHGARGKSKRLKSGGSERRFQGAGAFWHFEVDRHGGREFGGQWAVGGESRAE